MRREKDTPHPAPWLEDRRGETIHVKDTFGEERPLRISLVPPRLLKPLLEAVNRGRSQEALAFCCGFEEKEVPQPEALDWIDIEELGQAKEAAVKLNFPQLKRLPHLEEVALDGLPQIAEALLENGVAKANEAMEAKLKELRTLSSDSLASAIQQQLSSGNDPKTSGPASPSPAPSPASPATSASKASAGSSPLASSAKKTPRRSSSKATAGGRTGSRKRTSAGPKKTPSA